MPYAPGSGRRGGGRGGRPGGRRRSGSRPRRGRRGRRRGTGWRSRPPGRATRRSRRTPRPHAGSQRTEHHARLLVLDGLPARAQQAEARRRPRARGPAGAPASPPPRARPRASRARARPRPRRCRRRARRPPAGLARHRPRLAEGVGAHELGRRQAVVVPLLVPRRDHVEGKAELLEDRPPLRRGRGQEQAAAPRSPSLRARQISSDGHCRAHQRSGSPGYRCSGPLSGACSSTRSTTSKPGPAQEPDPVAVAEVELDRLGVGPLEAVHAEVRAAGAPAPAAAPPAGAVRIASVPLTRKTSSPPGRRSRAASGTHAYGSAQIEAPYSETARSKLASAAAPPRRSPRPAGTRARTAPASPAPSRAAPA